MKKRIYSLITMIMILFAGVFASACGNKYANMEFKVLYAYSEEAEEWFDGTDGISLNYSEDNLNGVGTDTSLIFNERGVAELYIKIEVKNVKAKYIDKMTVSFASLSGLHFSSKMVKQGEVFAVQIAGNVDTTLKIHENNSYKKKELPFVVSRELTAVVADLTLKPVVPASAGAKLSLTDLDNLKYEPINQTNQIGVDYFVESIGYYDYAHAFAGTINAEGAEEYVTIQNNELKILDAGFFASDAYIVRIKAQSKYYEEGKESLIAYFDVYVVERNIDGPDLRFEAVDGSPVGAEAQIYENGGDKYSTATVVVNKEKLTTQSLYAAGLNTFEDVALFEVTVYVVNEDGEYEKYDFGKEKYQKGINGLIVHNSLTDETLGDDEFKFVILDRGVVRNRVKFEYSIKGVDSTYSTFVNPAKEFDVVKGVVPTRITINDSMDLEDGVNENIVVYGTTSSSYKGYKLKVAANPNEDTGKIIEWANISNGLIVTDVQGNPVVGGVLTGSTIYVKFKNDVVAEQILTLRTLATPTYYNGVDITATAVKEYITVNFTVRKLVTADAFEFIAMPSEPTNVIDQVTIDAANRSEIYVKAYYTGVNLDGSTVTLTSNNDSIVFANGAKQISLNDADVTFRGTSADAKGKYDIYAIAVKSLQGLAVGEIEIVAGDEMVNVKKTIAISSAYLMSESVANGLKVAAITDNAKQFTTLEVDNGAFNFAVEKNQYVEFGVTDGEGNTRTINKIVVTAKDVAGVDFNKSATNFNVVSNRVFVADAKIGGKTQVLNVAVSYYSLVGGIVQICVKDLEVQIAVYDGIGNISAAVSKNIIGYINPYYKETSSTEIEFTSYTLNYATPASTVVFKGVSGEVSVAHASQVEVDVNNFNVLKNSNLINIEFLSDKNFSPINLMGASEKTILKNGDEDYLNGKIVVSLTGYLDLNSIQEISFSIRALKFGKESNVIANVVIRIAEIDTAERILVDGENLVSTSDISKELQLTFIDVPEGGYAEKDFDASLQFATATPSVNALRFDDIETSLTHLLYVYEYDENGELLPDPIRAQDDFLRVTYSNGKINVRANKAFGGGLFRLVLATKDSYQLIDEATGEFIDPTSRVLNEEDFGIIYAITIRVEDGLSTAFTIKTEEELLLVNNNLNKSFVLGAHLDLSRLKDGYTPIGLIGSTLNPFEGKFNGSSTTVIDKNEFVSTQYSITLTVDQSAGSMTYGTIYSLFGIVAEGAEISNLKINAKFVRGYTNLSSLGLKVGALAGVNNGRIRNVEVVLQNGEIEFEGVAGSLSMGSIVGLNNGEILNPIVDNSKLLKIVSGSNVDHNIGLIAGENGKDAIICGSYQGKESLNNYVYDVVANLAVENKLITIDKYYNVGLVAGYNDGGQIRNLLVGGQVELGRYGGDANQLGNLGGIVGESKEGSIETVVALSLNLISRADNVDVGGIVGKTDKTNIDYAKYVSVVTEFAEFTAAGQIIGLNNVAGIVATSTLGTIANSSVESFVDTINDEVLGVVGETFYTINNGTKTAGIVANGSSTISSSFVKANIFTNGTLILTSATSEKDSYFIGKVNNSTYTNKTTYSVVNGEVYKGNIKQTISIDEFIQPTASVTASTTDWTNIYYSEDGEHFVKANKFEGEKPYYVFRYLEWQTFAEDLVSAGTEGVWAVKEDFNVVNIDFVNLFFPYLTRDVDHDKDPETPEQSEPIMIVAPKDIIARIDQAYATDNSSVYIISFNIEEYEITESVIVNYLNGASDEDNAHNLISSKKADGTSEGDGIVDISLLPAEAQGLYRYKIIGTGRNYAYINSKNQIVFTGVSGSTPIVIYIYSGFNPEVYTYVAIYTQSLMTSLQLESPSICFTNQEDYEYEINLYTGQSNTVVEFEAENRVNGNIYTNLFEVFGIKQYLQVDTSITLPEGATSSKLELTAGTETATLRIEEGSVVDGDYFEIITFTMALKQEYFGSFATSNVVVKSVRLKVNLYNSASAISVDGEDAEITSSDDISFNVYLTTDYVKAEDYDSVPSKIEQIEISENGEILIQNTADRDGIKILLDIKDGFDEIEKLLTKNRKTSFAELFDAVIISSLYKTEQDNKVIGYKYNVSLELKDERTFRNITNNIKYDVVVYASSNADINNRDESMEILMKPTSISTARMETYAVKTLNVNTDYTDIVTNEDIQMSIIEPGSLGNVLMIYVEPAYANIETITLKTSELYVPSLGKKVKMKFTQLVLDKRKGESGVFTTLYGADVPVQEDDTLELKRVSLVGANGEEDYTGVLCVYIQLEKFSGLESCMTIELQATTQNGEIYTRTKDLLTTYLPGTYLNYDYEKLIGDGYLVQKGTSNNEVSIKIYGYQFNSNPTAMFKWNLLPQYDADGQLVYKDKHLIYEGDYRYDTTILKDKDGNLLLDENKNYQVSINYQKIYKDANNNYKFDTGETAYLIGDYVSYYLVNNYDEIDYNPADNSYTLTMILNVSEDIMASFTVGASLKLTTNDGQIAESNPDENKIVFYPTEYILQSVYVDKLSNGRKNIPINHSRTIDLKFTTDNQDNDMTDDIYKILLRCSSVGGVVDTGKVGNYFQFYKNGATTNFADDHSESFEFNMVNDKSISIFGVGKFATRIDLRLWYGYIDSDGDGVYELKFGQYGEAGLTSSLDFSFTLNIYIIDEDNELPIYSADEIYNPETGVWDLVEGVNYVLMNDIELERVVPITTAIGRLDGNNRVISIKSFAVNSESSNYGLFANIGTYTVEDQETEQEITKQTMLKNVIVDYSGFNGTLALNNLATTDIAFGGLVGVNDGGIIYNCDVINLDVTKDLSFDIIVASDSQVKFGGLVGRNTGIITNSRVGRDSYDRIVATKTVQSVTTKYLGGITWSIYNSEIENSNNNTFEIVSGGFVGENTGIISTSYVANSNLINYSTNETSNITAGFVGSNAGTLSYSYVKADEDTLTTTECYSTGYVIEHKGNGIVAGFVYNNNGVVTNCYSNIELKTESAYISGFVYNNNGSISVSYAATTMNSGSLSSNAEQPFVGVDNAGTLLSNGKIENSYYLMRNDEDNPYYQGDKDVARPLNRENFANGDSLVGFTFVLSNIKADREQGVWSYYTLNSKKRILPELINANVVAHSYRYVVDETALEKVFVSASSYALGSANNPYTISSVDEFNKVFTENGQSPTNQVGYVRMINNINFNDDETAIKTRSGFTLGSDVLSTKTSLEGNGMTISGIYLDAEQVKIDNIGLFGEIKNAYIKNLNLAFATPTTNGQFSTTTATYSGGLAGKITDSIILNVKLTGNNTTLTGNNFVGGLAGMISGRSLIYGVETNLNVKASGTEDKLYYNQQDYNALHIYNTSYETYLSTLSYAGGVAGVLDLTARDNIEHNVQFINVRGDQMAAKIFDGAKEANILAEYAGGVAGYASRETSSFKLKYITGKNETIRGNTAVGGLYGVYLGDILASQVSADEKEQYEYDTVMGEYIIGLETQGSSATLDKENAGNLTLIEGYKNVGGLIGVALNSNIKACYTKVGFVAGEKVGGLVGLNVACQTSYSYSIPYINSYSGYKYVGGLFGSVYGIALVSPDRNSQIAEFEALLNAKKLRSSNADVQFAYSTLIVDKNNFTTPADCKLDYLCPDYQDDRGRLYLMSNGSTGLTYVYTGNISDGKIVSNDSKSLSATAIMELYKLYNTGNPEQTISFQEVFSGWAIIKYWSLNESKYFPLLKNEMVSNFIDIKNDKDFKLLETNPKGNFRVVADITINMGDGSFAEDGYNWVITNPFEGVLIGELEDDSRRPRVTIINFNPSMANETAGFFKQTSGASISNLDFIWLDSVPGDENKQAITPGANLGMVSGLICDDNTSLISNVRVTAEQNDDYLINSNSTLSIAGFGGLVGYARNTNILSGVFAGKINVAISANDERGACVGGIVGYAETFKKTKSPSEDLKEESEGEKTCVINNVSFGSNPDTQEGVYDIDIPLSSLEISIGGGNLSNIHIGGIVGRANNIAIASSSIGGVAYDDEYQKIAIKINVDGLTKNFDVGSIVGTAKDGLISKSSALTEILVVGEVVTTEGLTPSFLDIGGLAGNYSISAGSLSSGITGCDIKCDIATFVSDGEVGGDPVEPDYPTELKTGGKTAVCIAGGVASMSGAVNMEQCLFTGSINTEESQIESLYVAGAVAYASNFMILSEITTYTDIYAGSISTKALYVGGLIGVVESAQISYSTSWGRIILITNVDAKDIYAGGLIGWVNTTGELTINNSYTLSSVIADSIATKQIKALNIGALIGSIKQKASKNDSKVLTSKTYYSSDIALTPDENYYGNEPIGMNLGAQTLIYGGSIWAGDLKTEDGLVNNLWTSSEEGVPYLTVLKDMLLSYDIIDNDGKYVVGSVMRPQLIYTGTEVVFESEYKFYLLKTDKGNKQLPKFSGQLNGVLFGEDLTIDQTFELEDGILTEYVGEGSYSGLIPAVAQHSAVSNLHIKLFGTITATNWSGIITGLNEGVVFNCSVQGNGVELSNSSGTGLIVGMNEGLISHCFSTAEIVVVGNEEVAGIVFYNNDKIMSCYFTGYLAGGTGIVYDSQTESYAYNNYMGGVVKDKAGANKFTATTIVGSNNYIDKYSDLLFKEPTVKEGEEKPISSVSTHALMSGCLNGHWHHSVDGKSLKTQNNETTSYRFGYNYNYPVYRFNRYIEQMGMLKIEDYSHQLYTGTGVSDHREDEDYGEKDNKFTQEDRYKALTKALTLPASAAEFKGNNYYHAYKIPHLGILTTVQSLVGTKNEEIIDGELVLTDRNYVVIYDLDGITSASGKIATYLPWKAIGTNDDVSGFGYIAGFNGVFVTNRYFAKHDNEIPEGASEAVMEGTEEDVICSIKNLESNGLFDNITNSYFADIRFGSFSKLNNSGALGVSVISESDVDEKQGVIINNVSFNSNSIITGVESSENFYAGLFGTIQGVDKDSYGKVTILNFSSANDSTTPNLKLEAQSGIVGLIAGKSSGKIILSEDLASTDLMVRFGGNTYAGGLVGELAGGTIVATKNTINISQSAPPPDAETDETIITTEFLGGIAGKVSKPAIIEGDLFVKFIGIKEDGAVIVASNNFGGATGFVTAEGALEIGTLGLQINGSKVQFEYIAGTSRFYGLIVGKQQGPVRINSFNFTPEIADLGGAAMVSEETEEGTFFMSILPQKTGDNKYAAGSYAESSSSFGVGALVGYQGGDLSIHGYNAPLIQLEARGVPNLGGVAGYYNSGSIGLKLQGEKRILFVLIGTTNVGGLYGYTTSNFENKTKVEKDQIDFLNAGFNYSHIIVDGSANDAPPYKNFGGLFGKWGDAGDIVASVDSIAETAATSEIVNFNNITIATGYKSGENSTIYNVERDGLAISEIEIDHRLESKENKAFNVGGIAGSIQYMSSSSLINNGFIELINENFKSSNDLYSAGDGENSKYPYCEAVNVGGIAGYVYGASLTDIYNNQNIYGYQNVGGLIGFGADSGSTIRNNAANPIFEDVNLKLGENLISRGDKTIEATRGYIRGAINVGGLIGYAGSGMKVTNINSRASVFGNTNVGGIVGLAEKATITNTYVEYCEIEIDEETEAPEGISEYVMEEDEKLYGGIVQGVYYTALKDSVTSDETIEMAFIPNSVGGFAGALTNYKDDSGSVIGSVGNNLVNGVKITSSTEGGKLSTISINENYMAEFDIGSNLKNKKLNVSDDAYRLMPNLDDGRDLGQDRVVKFNDIKTGFGGFAGTIDSSVISAGATQNHINDIDIFAQLGVNVGAYYGAFKVTEVLSGEGDEAINTNIEFPKLTSYTATKTTIDGAYNVGGFVGFVNGGDGNFNFNSKTVEGNTTIAIQSRLIGMYVGGLFGKTNADKINNLTLSNKGDVDVQIYTNKSYYIGGLIGRAENKDLNSGAGNMNLTKLSLGESDEMESFDPVEGNSFKNFGGLIGMLKTGRNSAGVTAKVQGTHYFEFTINVIENSNYVEGESRFNQEYEEGTARLYAEAYYLNEDRFEISGSSNENLYGGEKGENHNPFNPNAQGWSKQYTGFSKMQKRIVQSENNGADWDAIINVYDASKITHVGTINNLGLTGDWLPYAEPMLQINLIKANKLIVKVDSNGDGDYSDGDDYTCDTNDEWTNLATRTSGIVTVQYPKEEDVHGTGEDGMGGLAIDVPIKDRINAYDSLFITEWNAGNKTAIFHKDYICFTVYQQAENDEKLYSAMGIASAQYNQNTEDVGNDGILSNSEKEDKDGDNWLDAKQTYVSFGDQTAKWWQWVLGVFTAERPLQVFYLDCNYDYRNDSGQTYLDKQGLTYFRWGQKRSGAADNGWQLHKTLTSTANYQYTEPELIDGEDGNEPSDYTSGNIKRLVYFVEGYMGVGNAGATYLGDAGSKSKGANFVFDVVYVNQSTNNLSGVAEGQNGSTDTVSGATDDYVCMSGSLFDVAGIYTADAQSAMQNSEAVQWFKIVVTVVSIIVDIIVIVATWGVGTGAIAAGKTALKFAGKVGFRAAAKIFLKAAGKRLLRQIAKMGAKKLLKMTALSLIAAVVSHTITSMQLAQIFQGVASQNFYTPSPYNYGMLNTMYHREVRYERDDNDKIRFNSEADKYEVNDDGSVYVFYSSSRPKDFHENIYIGTKLKATLEAGTVESPTKLSVKGYISGSDGMFEHCKAGDFTKITEEVDIDDYTNEDGDETASVTSTTKSIIGYNNKEDDAYWQLEKKYEIIDGTYYINIMFANIESYRITMDFKPEKTSGGVDKTEPNYVERDGSVYVHGTWDGKDYRYAKKDGGLWVNYEDKEGYGDNNLRFTVTNSATGEGNYTINNIEDYNYGSSLIEKTVTHKYKPTIIDDAEALAVFEADKDLGYDYFNGYYYTTNGNASLTNPDDDTKKLVKYATFKKLASGVSPEGDIGVDYVQRNYEYYIEVENEDTGMLEDKLESVTYYYQLDVSIAFTNDGTPTGNAWYEEDEDNPGVHTAADTIVVPVYPKSSINPYKTCDGSIAKDNLIYAYEAPDSTSTNIVTAQVKYFLYEGGYYVQENIVDDFKEKTKPVYLRYDGDMGKKITVKHFDGLPLDEYGDVIVDDSGCIYGTTTTMDKVDDELLSSVTAVEIEIQAILDDYETYKEYYIVDQESFVADIFRVSNGYLYMLNSSYTLGEGDKLLHRIILSTPSEQLTTSKYEGMYLSNDDVKLYTRYRYNKNGSSSLAGVWVDGYSVIPKSGTATVNNGLPTILIETAKVILNANGKSCAIGNDGRNTQSIKGRILIK